METAEHLKLDDMLVRYADLRPCRTAFIDTKTPGSHLKENFTIIGAGVAENPQQHVHINRPHGFNIGGARQPPGCQNSQHFHDTAEVFFVHSGRWAFRTGEYADEGEIILNPGDVISIPTHIFRGFENVGDDTGFLYAVLGGSDAGRVTWAPNVLEKAKGYGLVLADSGRLVDTEKGENLRPDEKEVEPLTQADLEKIVIHANSDDLRKIVVPAKDLPHRAPVTSYAGISEYLVIGKSRIDQQTSVPPLSWEHGFSCSILDFSAGAKLPAHTREYEEVLFLHAGSVDVWIDDESATLKPGDVLSIPPGSVRQIAARSDTSSQIFCTLRHDCPAPPIFVAA
jgi:quercetin dioxygenase-like cupin family protein